MLCLTTVEGGWRLCERRGQGPCELRGALVFGDYCCATFSVARSVRAPSTSANPLYHALKIQGAPRSANEDRWERQRETLLCVVCACHGQPAWRTLGCAFAPLLRLEWWPSVPCEGSFHSQAYLFFFPQSVAEVTFEGLKPPSGLCVL